MAAPASSSAILPDLPGGMPHFPIQPWEREVEAWVLENFTDYPTRPGLIAAYKEAVLVRYPNVSLSPERLDANALVFLTAIDAIDDVEFATNFIQLDPNGSGYLNQTGTAIWHYTVERLRPNALDRILFDLNRWLSPGPVHTSRQYTEEMRAVYRGFEREKRRRERLAAAQGDRATLAQSWLVDFMSKKNPQTGRERGGLDAAQIVGQYHSGLITPRHVPYVPLSGPIRSNAAVLHEIRVEAQLAAEAAAAAAAAAANPAAAAAAAAMAVDGLNHAARRMEDLAESVANKRHKH